MSARILVVDDDPCMRELLKLHLRSAGYEVAVAEDAVVAGRMILKSPPDLLVMDVGMPYMNGFEFVATLVADQTVPCVPVIFLTAAPHGEIRAAELGAGFLQKPCIADDLLTAVERRLALNVAAVQIGNRPAVGYQPRL
jgi:DNA-binding response OmpR family regulator